MRDIENCSINCSFFIRDRKWRSIKRNLNKVHKNILAHFTSNIFTPSCNKSFTGTGFLGRPPAKKGYKKYI